jgi:hypothetical protein
MNPAQPASASNPPGQTVTFETSAVQNYLDTLQDVITRMAGNSSNCKSLCITLVSAIAVLNTDKTKLNNIWIALIPVLLFCFLDSYYLGLEQGFRGAYNEFVKKLKNDTANTHDLYLFIPKQEVRKRQADRTVIKEIHPFKPLNATLKALTSFAVYPFYLTLLVVLLLARFFILT